jgi:hypothetical protein
MSGNSPVKHPNSRKTILTITEGSERTYIHPYSYYRGGLAHLNTIQFLRTPEFKPHQEETESDFLYDIIKGKYGKFFRFQGHRIWDNLVRRIWALLKFMWQHKLPVRLLHYTWKNQYPVFCADIYRRSSISVPGTLVPSGRGQKMTDTAYLIPSQEWIKSKLWDWLLEPNRFYSLHDLHIMTRNSYLTWASEQVKMGRTIAFLSSLDT